MSTWNPQQYSAFLEQRTRPSRDLAQRVNILPRRVVDLGCGPGNSTAVCAERWPAASIVGLDSSPDMIAAARAAHPEHQWMVSDISQWISQPSPEQPPDLIFANAVLHWLDDHATLFPRLLDKLAPGGVLAAQMPAYDAIPSQLTRDMAAAERWRRWFPNGRANDWLSHSLDHYYALLAPRTKSLDLWATDYVHILPDVDAIVEWYKSTGLKPYLDSIHDDAEQREFLAEYRSRLEPHYPTSKAGGVPFVFRRLFLVAAV